MNLFVANLNYNIQEEELMDVFTQYGQVKSLKIIKDRMSGRSKGYGFVEMENTDEAQKAIDELNGREIHERSIIVKEARPPQNN